MWVRRAFFHWLLPSAVVLPLWLLIGWFLSDAGGWAFIWLLLIAMPAVLVGQLVLTFLVRARGTVRQARAVSWPDVAGFALWHLLTVAVGLYIEVWFWPLLAAAIAVFGGLVWLSLRQLLSESGPSAVLRRYTAAADRGPEPDAPVVVIEERREPGV
ncbi:MFS transporter permease [Microbacterium sp. 179-B 1A2 NHS]|uniref:MFS transporter permease n=1 Tax=Microbacterium sp. 179-B 1A2 NHS TaxID=3142383 RepID=UPI00399EFD7F